MFVSRLGAVRYALRPFLIVFIMDWLSATIGGAAGLAQGLVNQGFAKRNLKRQVAAQKELADYNADINKDLYTFQMEDQRNWNEHAEQLGKMAAAGINPLYADGGFQGAGSASVDGVSTGSAGMPQADMDFLSAVQAGLKQQEIKVQAKNADTNAKSVESQMKVNEAQIDKLLSDKDLNEQKLEESKVLVKDYLSQIDTRQKEVNLKVQDLSLQRLRLGLDFGAQKWKMSKESAEFGIMQQQASTDWYRAKTERLNYGLAQKQFNFMKEKWNKEYNLNFAQTYNDLMSGELGRALQRLDKDEFKNKLFTLTGKQMNELTGFVNAVITFTTERQFWPLFFSHPKEMWQLIKGITKAQNDLDNATLFNFDAPAYKTKPLFFDENNNFVPPTWSNQLTNP